ncbi:MAG: DUF255 domain-containing protein [Saprospiraceae bacterium]|nr:thioredoxin family protein [Bacteroidia bacterium]NNE16148.1 DUF255 domain-containing protein [Saprospiraceae bacterium]NNL92372.1 DUF255 domain-containing protein [Saprospiraceae bacterium]
MRYFLQYIHICLIAFFLYSCKTVNPNAEIPQPAISKDYSISFIENATLSYLIEKAKTENKLIFLDFYADWCGPCKVMDREVFQKKSVGDFFNEHFINFKVDAEKGGGPTLASLYEVTGYPTVVFIDPNGVVLNRQAGLIYEEQLMSLAEQSIHLYKISS